ncbi:MAG: PadR family transcriptional regulator [Nocardioides sp.]|uniref:PadR family transcriptional regulator n=1 Tax=Nocardioides sp. TaxID=35761 RepID=UPI0039E70D28
MSVKLALLALLEQRPMHGYQLRAEFEQHTGATWPLNVGQVYQTLSRLQRDGLVAETGVDEPVDAAGQHRVVYQPTEAGRAEVAAWFASPVTRSQPPRDELAIKLALAVTVPGVDVAAVIQQQRSATMAALQDYTRLKQGAGTVDSADLAWSLVLDALVFDAEAEIRWLDHCEARVRRAGAERRTPITPAPTGQAGQAGDTPEPAPSTVARPGAGPAR